MMTTPALSESTGAGELPADDDVRARASSAADLSGLRTTGHRVATISGRSRRLWLGAAEPVFTRAVAPVALVFTEAAIGLHAAVLEADELAAAASAPEGAVGLHGAPGRRYVYLRPVADLLKAVGITDNVHLVWADGEIACLPVTRRGPLTADGSVHRLEKVRGDGRLGLGPLRAFGPPPRLLRLEVAPRSRQVDLYLGIGLDRSDPAVLVVRDRDEWPHVYLAGELGRTARRVLRVVSTRGAWVFVEAELGHLCVRPLEEMVKEMSQASRRRAQ